MRASEEQRQHTETARHLAAEAEARHQNLRTLVGEETYAKALENGLPVIARLGGQVEVAVNAVVEAEAAYEAHQLLQPNTVRNYRVLSLDGSEVLAEFTDDRSMASMRAHKTVAVKKEINRYRLEEQLEDKTWVPFYKEHEGREEPN